MIMRSAAAAQILLTFVVLGASAALPSEDLLNLVYICDLLTETTQFLNQEDFQACGEPCDCSAFEAICIYENDDILTSQANKDYKIEIVDLKQTKSCSDEAECVICNTADENEWLEKTKEIFDGMSAPWRKPVPVPPYSADIRNMNTEQKAANLGKSYPQYDSFTTGPIALKDQCEDHLRCTLLYTKDYADKIAQSYPCGVLVYDVCYGAYFCGCENGYWRETFSASKDSRQDRLEQNVTVVKGKQTGKNVEANILKGAIIAGIIALVVCSVPCILCVIYYRKRAMTNEVDLMVDRNLDDAIWKDFNAVGGRKQKKSTLEGDRKDRNNDNFEQPHIIDSSQKQEDTTQIKMLGINPSPIPSNGEKIDDELEDQENSQRKSYNLSSPNHRNSNSKDDNTKDYSTSRNQKQPAQQQEGIDEEVKEGRQGSSALPEIVVAAPRQPTPNSVNIFSQDF